MPTLSLPLAFLAGLLSMLSPCVFSLVPIYLGYLSGVSLGSVTEETAGRWRVFSHALAFVAGFTFIFVVVMGLPATLLSGVLQKYSVWIARAGGIFLILFGLHTLHWIHIPIFDLTWRAKSDQSKSPGYVRSVLFGVTFASGWSPCVGPLLGLVMTLSFSEPGRAMVFMLAYAMGIAMPFLLAALLLSQLMPWMHKLSRYAQWIERASGGLLILIGFLVATGLFGNLNAWLIQLTPPWLLDHL